MGNTQDQEEKQVVNQIQQIWGQEYKNEMIEVDKNIAKCTEYDEHCSVLMQDPIKSGDKFRVKIHFDPNLSIMGIGVADFDLAKQSEFVGMKTYGLGHGLFCVYSDSIICSSNDEEQNKKLKGFNITDGDIILLERIENDFNIVKELSGNSITFQLDQETQYHVCGSFFVGWNSEEGIIDNAYFEII